VWLGAFLLTVNIYVNHVEDANRDPRLETRDVPVASTIAHLVGGFLVGLGTKLSNGCTCVCVCACVRRGDDTSCVLIRSRS